MNLINKLNKLLLFNWIQIRKNYFVWTLLFLCSISQFVILLALYLTNTKIIDYSVISILIPNILNSIFIIYCIVILFEDNKKNTIDVKLLCSNYSNNLIKISRFLFILFGLMFIIFIQNVFLLFLVIIALNKYALIYFLTNTFITPFILVCILLLNILISKKTSKTVYILISILILFLTFGISLITRFVIPSDEINDTTSKLGYKNSQYILDFKDQKPFKNLNTAFINCFIPSEWFLSYYSSLFNHFDFEINNAKYGLLSYNLSSSNLNSNNNDVGLILRPNDINPLQLSDIEYENLIFENINKIIKKYNLNEDSTIILQTKSFIESTFDWNNLTEHEIYNLLADLTGVNTEFNQLFYLIKYKTVLLNKVPNIFEKIKININKNLGELLIIINESNSTFYNLFKSSNKFNVNLNYPNDYIINVIKPVVNQDKLFIKDTLFKFVNNQPLYLTKKLTYKILDPALLPQLSVNLHNYNTWSKYIDENSICYKNIKTIINNLNINLNDIFNYELSKNDLDFRNINQIYFLSLAPNAQSYILNISLIFILNISLCCSFFINYKKG